MTSRSDLGAADQGLIERFEAAGQGHVFRFLDELDDGAARALLDQAATLDLSEVATLAAKGTAEAGTAAIAPPGDELIALSDDADGSQASTARQAGLELLREGRVAVVIAAGGQGTRLGSDRPKALFPVGPITGRSLLAWQAAKVRHWTVKLGKPIPLVLMLSDATEEATQRFLADYQCFGLDPAIVHTPVQGSLPPLDDDGKLLLATRSRIATSPNGHGGLYRALTDGGVADRLADAGITTLSYVQIDNPLIQPLDPVFLGHHTIAGSQISSKSVAKTEPSEKVGVFGRVGGRPSVIEYSELSEDQSAATDDEGRLLYGQGSIAAHLLDLGFAREMARQGLPVHRARKKVPHVDAAGADVRPETPNATKFEMFLFDAIPVADRSLVMETRREDEFSPIKNASGNDSAETAAAHLRAQFVRWYENAGLTPPEGPIEIDPEEAPDEAAFREKKGVA
jgi:UDP-N-acetylglucosamine/UDP-N-acetylgalactosamine diphosphorylase